MPLLADPSGCMPVLGLDLPKAFYAANAAMAAFCHAIKLPGLLGWANKGKVSFCIQAKMVAE